MFKKIKTAEQFIQYALRRLGHPVINIELSDEQVFDRLDDAVQKFSEYHYDGFDEGFLVIPMKSGRTEYDLRTIVDSEGNKITDKIILNVVNELDYATMSDYMLKASLHMLYNPLLLYNSYRDYDNFYYTIQYMDMIKDEFLYKTKFTFNYTNQKLVLKNTPYDEDKPQRAFKVYYIEGYTIDDDENAQINADIFNNMWLKEYFTELLRRQWGQNVSKYDITLTGGGKLNADRIIETAEKNIEKLETRLDEEFNLPPKFFMG